MRIECPTTLTDLEPYAEDWDRLSAGVPFRSWTWLSNWWRCYGPQNETEAQRRQLATLCAFDDQDKLVGIAPWYLERSTRTGRVLRPLGSGDACSEYLSVLCQPAREDAVLEALADYLLHAANGCGVQGLEWDLLALNAVDAADRTMGALVSYLAIAGCSIHCQPGMPCWRLELPADWEAYLCSLESKNLRRDLRRLERQFLDSQRAQLHVATCLEDLPRAMAVLVDLHQRRRKALGEAGCFARSKFAAFYHSVVPDLLRRGNLNLCWLEIDGQPVAAEYQLVGAGVMYAYVVGMDPNASECEPGKLHNLVSVRQAIAGGYRAFDFLRGDEPYKRRFGGQPQPMLDYRIVPDKTVARVRHGVWMAGKNLKKWVKRGIGRKGPDYATCPPQNSSEERTMACSTSE